MSRKEIKRPAWDNFCDAMDFESDDRNFKHDFGVMTKKFGNAYIEFCKAAWEANDGVMSEEEFMKMNANMPRGFFDRVIKT
jgi:hypothetical protein